MQKSEVVGKQNTIAPGSCIAMNSPIIFLALVRIYATLWIIIGGVELLRALYRITQGEQGLPSFTIVLSLLIGIGLWRQRRSSWVSALVVLFTVLAFMGFVFLIAYSSSDFASSAITIKNFHEDIQVPNRIFYPTIFGVLVMQIVFLLSKPIQSMFSSDE